MRHPTLSIYKTAYESDYIVAFKCFTGRSFLLVVNAVLFFCQKNNNGEKEGTKDRTLWDATSLVMIS